MANRLVHQRTATCLTRKVALLLVFLTLALSETGGPKVYDVTSYLDDHPGGGDVLLDVAGQDADEFFEDVGHSKDAREDLKKFYVGEYKMDEATKQKMKEAAEREAQDCQMCRVS